MPAWVYDEGDDSAWWDSEDAQWLLESLTEALDACASEKYFGSHEGDGTDSGF